MMHVASFGLISMLEAKNCPFHLLDITTMCMLFPPACLSPITQNLIQVKRQRKKRFPNWEILDSGGKTISFVLSKLLFMLLVLNCLTTSECLFEFLNHRVLYSYVVLSFLFFSLFLFLLTLSFFLPPLPFVIVTMENSWPCNFEGASELSQLSFWVQLFSNPLSSAYFRCLCKSFYGFGS